MKHLVPVKTVSYWDREGVKMNRERSSLGSGRAWQFVGERLQVSLGELGCSNHAGLEANHGAVDEISPQNAKLRQERVVTVLLQRSQARATEQWSKMMV
jgi:hypothetical protein